MKITREYILNQYDIAAERHDKNILKGTQIIYMNEIFQTEAYRTCEDFKKIFCYKFFDETFQKLSQSMEPYSYFTIDYESIYEQGYFEFYFYVTRPETDDDVIWRLQRREQQKLSKQKSLQAIAQKEKELYETLKQKYEVM